MIHKHLLRPDRLRQIPATFSWVDHRLIRHAHLRRCEPRSWALYLFLVSVADVQGLSYYSDGALTRHLNCDGLALAAARQQLMDADLVAFAKPLYQVLALSDGPAPLVAQQPSTGEVRSVGEILRSVFEGAQQ